MKAIFTIGLFIIVFQAKSQVSLEVSITDLSSGVPIESAEVSLVNTDIGYSSNETTNKQGKIIFRSLSLTGIYIVKVKESEVYDGLESRT